jgi:hypothetical protein
MRSATRWLLVLIAAPVTLGLIASGSAQPGGFRSPEECLAYTGDAHLNCLYAYIEIQQGKITKLQEDMATLKANAAQLQDQANRQASMTEELRRGLAEREKIRQPPLIQVYPYFGYGFSFGGPWAYGTPFHYGYRFFGPCYGAFPAYPCW